MSTKSKERLYRTQSYVLGILCVWSAFGIALSPSLISVEVFVMSLAWLIAHKTAQRDRKRLEQIEEQNRQLAESILACDEEMKKLAAPWEIGRMRQLQAKADGKP